MDMMNRIIDDVCREQESKLEKLVADAFENHFGISICDVDLRDIEHIRVAGDPIESYRYRGETFLYAQVPLTLMSTRIHKVFNSGVYNRPTPTCEEGGELPIIEELKE